MTQGNARTTMRQGLTTILCLTSLFVGVAGMRADAQTTALVAKTAANAVDVIAPDGAVTSLAVGAAPTDVAVSQDGTFAYVLNSGANTVSVIKTTAPPSVLEPAIRLLNQPSSIAVDSVNNRLFVLESDGSVEVLDATTGVLLASVNVGGSGGQIAVTRDGNYAFVAAGNISVIDARVDKAVSVIASLPAEQASTVGVSNVAVGVAISPDDTLAFVSVVSYVSDSFSFRVSGGLAVVVTNKTQTDIKPVVTSMVPLYSQPGSIAFTADGQRAYVAIESYWADTLYGAGFLPGRWVAAIDNGMVDNLPNPTLAGWIDLGAGAAASPTPAGLAVAPDRSALFVSIPRNNSVIIVDPTTDQLKPPSIAIDGTPNGVAVLPNPSAKPTPFVLHATDDIAPNPFPAQHAALAIADVLANDTVGGGRAALGNVTLSVAPPASAGLTLDTSTGAVWVGVDAAVGSHTLTYQICEAGNADVCATAAATVTVRERYAIAATDDRATSLPGGIAVTNVVANDTLGADAASLANVSLIAVSSDGAVSLNAGDGSVVVAAGAARGDHVLTYRICEIADPTNCSSNGTATVTVVWRDIQAANDSVRASKAGGTAIANVLANDTFDGRAATLAGVTVSSASTGAGVTLDGSTGAVSVAAGTPIGSQTVAYRICERANAANCAEATVTVTVTGYVVNAVADSARASSKNATMAVVNVLANDTIGGAPANAASVNLSLVSISPANRQIQLNSNGTVDILGKSGGGTYSLRYQICDVSDPTNCAQATLSLNLSGK